MSRSSMFRTHHDLAPATREKSIALLNRHLADHVDLYSQIKQAHWNVKGPHFIQLHLFFDTIAEEIEEHIDTIAERATALGGRAMGTTRMAAKESRLPEYPAAVAGLQHVEALVERVAAVAKSTRAAIDIADKAGDAGTTDLFTQISRDLDKQLWMLEAHLQSPKP
ncbi:MAG TPA: DNA starvation/stationary phase protection protein Dps [Phycisphaerales bacterium]|nr:DNA starvation/stationary phase protection protein Dps [Phycisphaerales bacterium]